MPAATTTPCERFRALLIARPGADNGAAFTDLAAADLPAGETVVAVSHSSLNYKDALAVSGRAPVLRRFPMVPGIDLAGTVLSCTDGAWRAGDAVFATGWGLGEERWGGYAAQARLPSAWLQPVAHDAAWCMALGTAGLTAALAVQALDDHGVTPGAGMIAVTGASGGVGSIAVMLLAARGFRVAAVSGRPELSDWLRDLGASDVVPRASLIADAAKPLAGQRWTGGIDAVGGEVLAGLLSATASTGCVAACGLAGGTALATTVMPFILRGVSLIGIESVRCAPARRQRAWAQLAAALPPARLRSIIHREPLAAVASLAGELLDGHRRGRVVLDVSAMG